MFAALFVFEAVSYIIVYSLWTKFTNAQFFWNIALLSNKTFHILCSFCAVVLCGITLFSLVKYNIFSFSKIINRVDRAESDAYGSSRWQSKNEIKNNYGFHNFSALNNIEAEGYVIASEFSKKSLHVSMIAKQHCLTVGTSGTGKSYYFLGPTIQANAHSKTKPSMVINDLKGELYSEHSKMLKEQGYEVIRLDLRNPHTSDRYNPLSLIWDLYQEYLRTNSGPLIDRVAVYINEIAANLCPIGQGDQQQWSQGAQAIIKSIIWALLEDGAIPEYGFTREMFTILQISNIANRQKKQLLDFLTQRKKTSPVFDYAGMILDNPSEKTVGSYYATLSTALEGFLEPGLQKVTSDTDIDITKLSSTPTALFIIIPDELKTRNIVGTMIVSQIYNYLTFEASQLPGEKLKKNVYFLLDEFGNLPIIQNFPSWVALGRSRGIFFNIIIQADSQLNEVYGQNGAKTIMQNCHLQVLLGASEIETLKRFEDLFGKYTVYQRNANIDQSTATLEYKGSTGLTSIDLITLDQLQRMSRGDIFFKLLGAQPCRAKLIPLFDEKAQSIFKRGPMIEKGLQGRAIEIDKEKLYYDLSNRYQEYLRKNHIAKQANSSVAEEESDNFKLVRIEIELFEAIFEDLGFEARNTTDSTVDLVVPLEKIKFVQEKLREHTQPSNQPKRTLLDRNSELFGS